MESLLCVSVLSIQLPPDSDLNAQENALELDDDDELDRLEEEELLELDDELELDELLELELEELDKLELLLLLDFEELLDDDDELRQELELELLDELDRQLLELEDEAGVDDLPKNILYKFDSSPLGRGWYRDN